MNILIVSYEAWQETNNGGNVLSNVFNTFKGENIAQIYCSGELPNNRICKKYFQISDSMLFSSIKGNSLEEKDYYSCHNDGINTIENRVKTKTPGILKEFALLVRELIWTTVNWKTKELEQFVSDFNPDIIFAPCYSYFHVSKLALHVKKIAKCPMISYISDDNYSLRQFRISPSFLINRLITRKWIRKHFAESSLVYTMTELQKKEYEKIFNIRMKVLCKSAVFLNHKKESINQPIKLIYGGGLYLNRWKILLKLVETLGEVNTPYIKAQLHIYSGSKLKPRIQRLLDDGVNAFLHDAISFEELEKKYLESDIAVHVESFDVKNSAITRLSFSTKIIDCMKSGCAVLAIGPRTQAGIEYLAVNDAAICVNDISQLKRTLKELINSPELIYSFSEKACSLGVRNHNRIQIEKGIRQDFNDVITCGTI